MAQSFASTKKNLPTTPIYGALDLGTNSCRMIIARPGKNINGAHGFHLVSTFSRMVKLGEKLSKTRKISSSSIHHTLKALEECAKRLQAYQALYKRCVATQACRQALNSADFLKKIHQKTGLTFEVISPEEESHLAVQGCIDLMDCTIPYGIVFDIGGGSTEIAFIRLKSFYGFDIIDSISLPYGILTVSEEFIQLEDKKNVSSCVFAHVKDFATKHNLLALIKDKKIQMIGTSGTITTIGAIALNLSRYNRSKVHKAFLSSQSIHHTLSSLWQMSPQEMAFHPCVGPHRTSLLLSGVAIFQGLYRALPANPLMIADRGVKEGVLRHLMMKNMLDSPSCAA